MSDETPEEFWKRMASRISIYDNVMALAEREFSPFVRLEFKPIPINQEALMAMEKRAVVDTEKEKTAHEKIKTDLSKTNTAKIPPKKKSNVEKK